MKFVFFLQIIYSVFVSIFLYNLDKLNKILLLKYRDQPLELLSYNNYQPLCYFGYTVFWILIGLGFLIYHVRNMKSNLQESRFLFIISLIGAVASIIALIVFIDNPILRAILLAIASASILSFTVMGNG